MDDDDDGAAGPRPLSMQRVKLYRLNKETGVWDDQGTGSVSVEILKQSNAAGLVVISEENTRTLLIHRVLVDVIYARQGDDTIITWPDLALGTDIALSFQDAAGCEAVWAQIQAIQGRSGACAHGGGGGGGGLGLSAHLAGLGGAGGGGVRGAPRGGRMAIDEYDGTAGGGGGDGGLGAAADGAPWGPAAPGGSGGAEPSPGPPPLPDPEYGNLAALADALADLSPYDRERAAAQLLAPGVLARWLEAAGRAEDVGDAPGLAAAYRAVRGAILLNDAALLEEMLSDEHADAVVGALEYEALAEGPAAAAAAVAGDGDGGGGGGRPARPSSSPPPSPSDPLPHRPAHRAALAERTALREVVPLPSDGLRAKVRAATRAAFLRDAVLPRALDDGTHATLASLAVFNAVEVLSALQADAAFLPALFARLRGEPVGSPAWADGAALLQEMVDAARHLPPGARGALLARMAGLGLFEVMAAALAPTAGGGGGGGGAPPLRLRAADVLLSAASHDAGPLRDFMLGSDLGRATLAGIVSAALGEEEEGEEGEGGGGGGGGGGREGGGRGGGGAAAAADAAKPAPGPGADGGARPPAATGNGGPHPRATTREQEQAHPPPAPATPTAHGGGPGPAPPAGAAAADAPLPAADAAGGLQESAVELLRALLDPDTMALPAERSPFLDAFYEHHVGRLVAALGGCCGGGGGGGAGAAGGGAARRAAPAAAGTTDGGQPPPPPPPPRPAPPAALGAAADLLCYCVACHGFRAKYYVLRHDVGAKVLALLGRREAWLRLAAVRFVRTCVGLRDDFYARYVVRQNLVGPLLASHAAGGGRRNLYDGALLELLDAVRRDNARPLLAHLVTDHGPALERLGAREVVQGLRLRHAQNVEMAAAAAGGGGGGAPGAAARGGGDSPAGPGLSPSPAAQPPPPPPSMADLAAANAASSAALQAVMAAARARRDARALEPDEEQYFDGDDDDDEEEGEGEGEEAAGRGSSLDGEEEEDGGGASPGHTADPLDAVVAAAAAGGGGGGGGGTPARHATLRPPHPPPPPPAPAADGLLRPLAPRPGGAPALAFALGGGGGGGAAGTPAPSPARGAGAPPPKRVRGGGGGGGGPGGAAGSGEQAGDPGPAPAPAPAPVDQGDEQA